MSLFLLIVAMAVPSYLLGGINGAIITSRYIYRKDIRNMGSGNPGLTNFCRVFGKSGVMLVLVIDVIKTVCPVLIAGWMFSRYFDMALLGRHLSGFFVMLGHCYPPYYNFKGGKGVMAAGSLLFLIDWRIGLIMWGLFGAITLATRFVSLGSITAAITYPAVLVLLGIGEGKELFVAIMCAVLLILRHSQNIIRLANRKEPKIILRRGSE